MKRFFEKSIKCIYYAILVFWIMVTIIGGLTIPKYVPSGDRAFYLIANLSLGLAFLVPLIIFGLAFKKTEKIKFFRGISSSAKGIRATILSAIVFALMMVVCGNVENLYSDELRNTIEVNRKMYEQKEALAKELEVVQNNDKQSNEALEIKDIKAEENIEALDNAEVEKNSDKPVDEIKEKVEIVKENSTVSKQSIVTPQKTNNDTTQKNTETIKQEESKKQPIKEDIKKEEPKKEEIKNETPIESENKKPSSSNTSSNNSSTNSSDKVYYVVSGNRYYHIKKDCKFIKGGSVESTSNISGKFACNCVKY